MDSSNILTTVAKDWTPSKLQVMQEILLEAERDAVERSSSGPGGIAPTPNQAHLRGSIRWYAVGQQIFEAIRHNRFPGITAKWVDLKGVSALELSGEHTTLTPYHLNYPNSVPRESEYRRSRRVENYMNPNLTGFPAFETDITDDGKVHLLLVHGGKDETFAYLRAYIDPQNPEVYRDFSKNIMLAPNLVTSLEVEHIDEPAIELKPVAASNIQGAS